MNRGQNWLSQRFPNQAPNAQDRAVDSVDRVADRPTWIVVSRLVNGVTVQLAPQQVRIEVVQNVRTSNEVLNRVEELSVSEQYVVVLATRNSAIMPDNDLRRADLFFYQNRQYEILEIIDTVPGRLLCSAKLTP